MTGASERPVTGGPSRSFAVLLSATSAWLRLESVGQRLLSAQAAVMEGFLLSALTVEEQSVLTVRAYELHPGSLAPDAGLFDWEKEWFARDLPAPPARLFVGAAGAGREIAVLRRQGYEADALEPSPGLAARCAAVAAPGRTVVATYADLCRAILDDGDGPAAVFAGRTYDAVILGWGSLTHVLIEDERRRVLAAATRLAPTGPVLASFYDAVQVDERSVPDRRAARLGRGAGRLVGRRRRVPAAPPDIRFFGHVGFCHAYTRDELDGLAAAVGRTVVSSEGKYGHATFVAPPRSP